MAARGRADNSGRSSRCSHPQKAELTWQDYEEHSHEGVVAFDAWYEGLPDIHKPHAKGELIALRTLAKQGRIIEGNTDQLKPIVADPDVWELKWKILGTKIRQYHAEPSAVPAHLVDLHSHVKETIRGDHDFENEKQNEHIGWAVLRYRAGERSNWGISDRH